MKKTLSINLTPFIVILTGIFFILKILGVISWSWFWVFSPIVFGLISIPVIFIISKIQIILFS